MKSESFGEYIRKLRQNNKLPLRIVAAEIDIDQSTLSKIERNEKLAPQYIIKPLAKLYNEDYRLFQTRYLSEKLYRETREYDYALEAIEITRKRLKYEKKGTQQQDKKQIIVNKLKTYLAQSPIEKAWIFGSFAKDKWKYDSDIDILIQLKKSAKLDLLDYIGITHELEDLLQRNVDLVQEGTLNQEIEEVVNSEKVLIYET